MLGIRLLRRPVGATLALAVSFGLADTQADTATAKQGEQVFLSHGCGYCHENGGRTAGKGPQLMGTSRDDAFIAFRITNGKQGKMPAFGSSLTSDQILDLIAYIRSLKE
jgi:mono/diheme cytochrome c family protein